MSFSSDVRRTLCGAEEKCEACTAAELAGIMSFSGRLSSDELCFLTEKDFIADKIASDILKCTGKRITYSGEKNIKIEISDSDMLKSIREKTGIAREDFEKGLNRECCRRAYIRGAFLGGGCAADPKKNYHLEFDTKYKLSAERLVNVMSDCRTVPKLTYRKGHYLVYLKSGDDIADVLCLMGDNMSALSFYTAQMEKDVRNTVNRQVNCEMANQRKTSAAAMRQLAAIKKIKSRSAMTKLPAVLREIAEVREMYPDVSLKELGGMLNPPIGKSGVNHRLNRIMEYAENC